MAGPTPQWDIPNPLVRGMWAELNSMRDDIWPAFVCAALAAGQCVIGWNLTSTVMIGDLPSQREWTWTGAVTKKCKINYTYTGDFPATLEFRWDKGQGAGYENVVPGKATLAYDGVGNLTGVTWSNLP